MEYIILDDLFGVKLWGENIFRRVYHHLSNNNYDPRRVPLLHKVRQLTDEHVAYLQGLTFDKDTALNTNKLSLLVGGQYSPRDTLYFNNMDKDMQIKLEDMGNSFIPHFETILGTKLRLGDSNFRAIILRYEGANAQFGFHYDTEHPDCFRTLMLYEGGGIIPPFCYRDGECIQKVHFQVKDGILFRGTTTHHGVEPSKDPTTKRYMVGFQYIKEDSDGIEKHSLCNQLRGSSIQAILSLFIPYAAYYQMAKYLPTVIPWTSLVGLVGCLSPTNTLCSVVQFYVFCCFMTMDARLALQVTAYILFTEKILSMDHKNLLSAM